MVSVLSLPKLKPALLSLKIGGGNAKALDSLPYKGTKVLEFLCQIGILLLSFIIFHSNINTSKNDLVMF